MRAVDSEQPQVVVAALIERGGFMLISQRRPDVGHAGRWEFPGGKREPGEDDGDALRRELREELGICLPVGHRAWTERSGPLELRFYWCAWAERLRPRPLEVVQFRWVRTASLPEYAFPPADSRLVQALAAGRLSR
jgi:mutator protein MutT